MKKISDKQQAVAGLFITAITLAALGLACSGGSSNTPTKTVDGKEVKIEIGKPDQVEFHAGVKKHSEAYYDADNEMKKSKVYRELKSFLQGHLKTGSFQEWQGELTDIGTTEGGSKVHITIKANYEGRSIEYKTWNNQLSDYSDRSMINIGSSVYKQVENLSEGDTVVFSGRFIRDHKKGFSEASLTEQGTVTSPSYIIRFSTVSKLENK